MESNYTYAANNKIGTLEQISPILFARIQGEGAACVE